MKTIYLFIIIGSLTLLPLQAQLSLERQVLATGGKLLTGTTLITSATLGEAATLTLKSQNLTLTQGFQQPSTLIGTPIAETLTAESTMTVFPNPTSGEVSIWVEGNQEKHLNISLTDMLGRPVAREVTVLEGEGRQRFILDLTSLPSGLYLVSFFSGNGEFREVVKVEKR
jgi:hypothetical protein